MSKDEIKNVGIKLTKDASIEIARRKKFEESAERDPHFLFVIPNVFGIPSQPAVIAIIANRNISHYGHRYLPHYSNKRNINFFGAIIGEASGLLFLDPIAIGYHEGSSDDTDN